MERFALLRLPGLMFVKRLMDGGCSSSWELVKSAACLILSVVIVELV